MGPLFFRTKIPVPFRESLAQIIFASINYYSVFIHSADKHNININISKESKPLKPQETTVPAI